MKPDLENDNVESVVIVYYCHIAPVRSDKIVSEGLQDRELSIQCNSLLDSLCTRG